MDNSTRQDIFDSIQTEREYQDQKWGTAFDDKNTANDWVAYIAEYSSRGCSYENDVQAFRTAMLKTATLAVAALEATDRNNGLPKRHYD